MGEYPPGGHPDAQSGVGAGADPNDHFADVCQGDPGLIAGLMDERHELFGMGAGVVVVQADEHLGPARQTDADGRRGVDSQNDCVHQLLSPVSSGVAPRRSSDSGDRSTSCQRGPKPSR